MASKATTKQDEIAVLSLARGRSYSRAAQESGLSARTIARRMSSPEFRSRVQERRAGLIDSMAGRLAAGGSHAIATLRELLESTAPPATRMAAAKAIVELTVRLREAGEIERRLAELEEAVRERETPC